MHVILMGPQGSGKGTQAARLAPRLDLALIATGDLFRSAIAGATDLGTRIKDIYDRGELVPDELTIALVEEKLAGMALARARGKGIQGGLFDGFPRNRSQAEALDEALRQRDEEISVVVRIEVPPKVLIRRLAGRRVCSRCGAVYHVEFNPPREPGTCDICGGEVRQREDDTAEAVQKRLDLYLTETEPVVSFYRDRGIVTVVDGNQEIELVTAAILGAVNAKVPTT